MAALKDPEELEKDLPEADEDGGSEPAAEVAEPREPDAEVEIPIAQPSRKERRANRVKEFEERARAAERERDELRSRISQVEQRSQQQGNPQQAQQNRHEIALHQVYQEIDRLHQEYNVASQRPGFSDADRKPYEERARRLDMQKHAIIADARQPQLDMAQLVRHVQWKAFESEHSDVFGNEQIKNWAWAEYNKRKAEGHPETRELALQTLDKARVRFGLQPRNGRGSAPDQATRQRLSGVRSSAGGGGSNGDPVVKMGKHERRMAETLYSDLPAKEAWQKWANGPGKRILAKQK